MKAEWLRAVTEGDVDALHRLAGSRDVVDSHDRYGQTGLMLAAKAGQADVVRALIEMGADLNCTAKYNLSAVMLAVINGHAEVVRALREAGADLSIAGSGAPGFAGKTALDLAAGRDDLVEALTEP